MSNSVTLLDQISSTQATKEVVANALFDSASPAMLWGRRASTTAGLTWGYYGGTYCTASSMNTVANGTLTLTASATNYLYASATTGAVSVNTTGFPTGAIPLYSIVTGATAVTSYTDCRSYQPSAIAGAVGTVTSVGATGGVETDQGTSESESADDPAITTSGKIRTVVKLAGGAIQSAAYTYATSDRGACLVMSSSSAVTQSLPAATGSSGNFPAGWWGEVQNIGASALSLGVPSGTSLDGVSNGTVTLATGTGLKYFTDGANWFTVRGAATGGGGSGGMTNPMTAAGDIITGASGGTPQRLAIGNSGQVLTVVNGQPAWAASGSGSANAPADGSPDTPPVLSAFSWLNQGSSAQATQQAGFIDMSDSVSASGTIRALIQSAPAAPYSIAVRMKGILLQNYQGFGLILYDSTTGKALTFGPIVSQIEVFSWNSVTSTNSQLFAGQSGVPIPAWMMIRDDGTNLYFSVSTDGVSWVRLWSAGRTAYLSSPGHVGFYFMPNGAAMQASLHSWAQGT